MSNCITVIGSTNTDMVMQTDHLPAPGETIIGENFFMSAGGKGANQAVAAARAGGNVTFITKVGNDVFGNKALTLFKKENIDASHVYVDPVSPSGVALITVDKNGENCIVVASGANATLSADDLQNARASVAKSSFILVQLEIPLATIEFVGKLAAEFGIPLILNPAPACALPDSLMTQVSIITPNETEAEMLTGINFHARAHRESQRC
jgi:ribokinase